MIDRTQGLTILLVVVCATALSGCGQSRSADTTGSQSPSCEQLPGVELDQQTVGFIQKRCSTLARLQVPYRIESARGQAGDASGVPGCKMAPAAVIENLPSSMSEDGYLRIVVFNHPSQARACEKTLMHWETLYERSAVGTYSLPADAWHGRALLFYLAARTAPPATPPDYDWRKLPLDSAQNLNVPLHTDATCKPASCKPS